MYATVIMKFVVMEKGEMRRKAERDFMNYAMKIRRVTLHAFLTSALDRGESSAFSLRHMTPKLNGQDAGCTKSQ
jgi:hypothetical protein